MAHAPPSTFSILLVIVLGFVKRTSRRYLSNNRFRKIDLSKFSRTFGGRLLRIIKIEDGASVTITYVRTLTIQLRRIMHSKELPAKSFIVNDIRIKFY